LVFNALAVDARGGEVVDFIQGESGSRKQDTSDGVVDLQWSKSEGKVELRHVRPGGTEAIRKIEGGRTVLSGLEEGNHQFFLRQPGGEWGRPLVVENRYMERDEVVFLLVIGGLIVLAVVVAVILGSLRKEGG